LLDRVARLPGVSEAAAASHLPLSDGVRQIRFRLDERPLGEAANSLVTVGYFHAVGISMLRAREFSYHEGQKTPPVEVVNETFTNKFLIDIDPIGGRFQWEITLCTTVAVVHDVASLRSIPILLR
jgi:putative ABC transport system permease protein